MRSKKPEKIFKALQTVSQQATSSCVNTGHGLKIEIPGRNIEAILLNRYFFEPESIG